MADTGVTWCASAYENALDPAQLVVEQVPNTSSEAGGLGRYEKRFGSKSFPAKLAWYRANGILPSEEGRGERGVLILTQDGVNGSIDAAKIDRLRLGPAPPKAGSKGGSPGPDRLQA
jgi:hypothetical protein